LFCFWDLSGTGRQNACSFQGELADLEGFQVKWELPISFHAKLIPGIGSGESGNRA